MRALALLMIPVLLVGCDNDCTQLDRMDGTYATWMALTESASGETGPVLSEGYPTQELFINGWSRWQIANQGTEGDKQKYVFTLTDVLERTDLPGELPVYKNAEIRGYAQGIEGNCNVLDLSIEDSYTATVTEAPESETDTPSVLSQNVHTFTLTAQLVFSGDQIIGSYTYADTFEGIDGTGAGMSGSAEAVKGSFTAILQTDGVFDTGFTE